MEQTIQPNFKIEKQTIMRFAVGGIIYYYLKLPGLRKKNQDICYNVRSPFRKDNNPSFSIKRNPSNNRWYFFDFGDPDLKGDVFDFAARCYNLSVEKDFREILYRMYNDLQIDKFDKNEIAKLLNCEPCNIDYRTFIGNGFVSNYSESYASNLSEDVKFELDEKTIEELTDSEQKFLNKNGISLEILTKYNSCFLKGYRKIVNGHDSKVFKKPTTEIWIAYKFKGGAKIYCPYPKKFWYIGKPTKNYVFGTPMENPEFEDLTTVFLVGGEKDCLCLLSRGFNAMCLSSETKGIEQWMLKSWYFECHYNVVILYDIDKTGLEQAKKINDQFHLKYIILPDWLKEKGGKDISDFFIHGGTIDEFNQLINVQINNHCDKIIYLERIDNLKSNPSVRTALQRIEDARSQPDIKPHFDVFFQKGELAILFGDTGKGKSIAAVTLADALTKGESCMGLENAYGPLITLYYDFELSDKQFEKRYTNLNGECYNFSDCFFIDNLDFADLMPKEKGQRFENLLIDKIRKDVLEVKAEVVIIDNITYLTTQSAEDSQVALSLMRLLKELKTETGISILVLAHTPKKTNPFGITIQDLAGSKHIPNFADSVFALGYSTSDKDLRYLIQVKPSRSGELKYDKENVLVCEIEKRNNFLTLSAKGFVKESELLKQIDSDSEDELKEKAIKMKEEGGKIRDIADELGLSKSKVGRWTKET